MLVLLFVALLKDVTSSPSNASASGTTFGYENMTITTTTSFEDVPDDNTDENKYCCHRPYYTLFVLAGVMSFPVIICTRILWMKYKARSQRRGRVRTQQSENNSNEDYRLSIYTVENDQSMYNMRGPPPAYDMSSTSFTTEPPPPYDSPPPYSDFKT